MVQSVQLKASPFAPLRFRYPFRKYQQQVLEVVAGQLDVDSKYHIVAPPGSGKTIVGLELVRRIGRPAVVFAPTTTIQTQWQEKLNMFTADAAWIGQHSSLNAKKLASINILTYQVLSTPGENLSFVEEVAVERWVEDLLSSGQALAEDQARQRLATLQQTNPNMYRRELAKRYRRVKRDFLRGGNFDGRRFLHPNARDLIDRIVTLNTGTLVLDECHHLLDYWAFILRELIKSLSDVRVVGLTATLPDPANESEYHNYTSLLGEVDFEVPTPAVIKEGNLAPFRDLVAFCQPSPREQEYLDEIQEYFETAVKRITETPVFWSWVQQTVLERASTENGEIEPFEDFYQREPQLATAGVKYLLERDQPIPADIPLIDEMLHPLSVDDWLSLLETFGLQVLKLSFQPSDQALYRQLRQALLPFGISITERGIRHGRSPGDLVLALSESKDAAVAQILRAEIGGLGPDLRAVVITDFERLSARARRLKGILDPDAGSAVRVFQHLLADPETNTLDPILVTGKVVLVDADQRAAIGAELDRWASQNQLDLQWEWRETGSPWMLELAGRGRDWSPRSYVGLVTSLLEQGITRCLVGTRGIFGEGWDSLSLNTLIDLTSVTTRTGVQQIRGRGLRLDPQRPRKVTHNWDVVCIGRQFEKGDFDLRRFVARHRHSWGVVVGDKRMTGRIAKGLAHVDPQLSRDLSLHSFRQLDFEPYTQRALAAADQRPVVYKAWRIGEDYDNLAFSSAQIQKPQDIRFRTKHTIHQSLGTISRRMVVSLMAASVPAVVGAGAFSTWLETGVLGLVSIAGTALSGIGALAVGAFNVWRISQSIQKSFVDPPAEVVLQDMGVALLSALREVGLVAADLDEEQVQVRGSSTGGFEVSLSDASPQDSDTFTRALGELLGPLGDARYLIERDVHSVSNMLFQPAWLALRLTMGLGEDLQAYHRVPTELAIRKERAEVLAHHWRKFVGGGRLVYTRTAEGRRILLLARANQQRPVRQIAFEQWR